jgi:hypothetical protein
LLQWHRLQDEKEFSGNYSGLIHRIRKYMPVEAQASVDLVEFFEKEGKSISNSEKIEITDVFHPEDDEEILCSISTHGQELIAPLRFVNLDSNHPLHSELAVIK